MLLAAALRREKAAEDTIAQQAADLEQLNRLVRSLHFIIVLSKCVLLTGYFITMSSNLDCIRECTSGPTANENCSSYFVNH